MSIPNIYVYEVTMRGMRDGKQEMSTSIQHAYTIGDAVMQSVYILSGQGFSELHCVHVGPPLDAIRIAQEKMLNAINTLTDKIMKGKEE